MYTQCTRRTGSVRSTITNPHFKPTRFRSHWAIRGQKRTDEICSSTTSDSDRVFATGGPHRSSALALCPLRAHAAHRTTYRHDQTRPTHHRSIITCTHLSALRRSSAPHQRHPAPATGVTAGTPAAHTPRLPSPRPAQLRCRFMQADARARVRPGSTPERVDRDSVGSRAHGVHLGPGLNLQPRTRQGDSNEPRHAPRLPDAEELDRSARVPIMAGPHLRESIGIRSVLGRMMPVWARV